MRVKPRYVMAVFSWLKETPASKRRLFGEISMYLGHRSTDVHTHGNLHIGTRYLNFDITRVLCLHSLVLQTGSAAMGQAST